MLLGKNKTPKPPRGRVVDIVVVWAIPGSLHHQRWNPRSLRSIFFPWILPKTTIWEGWKLTFFRETPGNSPPKMSTLHLPLGILGWGVVISKIHLWMVFLGGKLGKSIIRRVFFGTWREFNGLEGTSRLHGSLRLHSWRCNTSFHKSWKRLKGSLLSSFRDYPGLVNHHLKKTCVLFFGMIFETLLWKMVVRKLSFNRTKKMGVIGLRGCFEISTIPGVELDEDTCAKCGFLRIAVVEIWVKTGFRGCPCFFWCLQCAVCKPAGIAGCRQVWDQIINILSSPMLPSILCLDIGNDTPVERIGWDRNDFFCPMRCARIPVAMKF